MHELTGIGIDDVIWSQRKYERVVSVSADRTSVESIHN
jgi:hypothetical protein